MPRDLGEPVERYHSFLYTSDLELLKRVCGKKPGVGPVIRGVVRQFCKRLQAKLESAPEPELLPEVELLDPEDLQDA